MARALTLPGTCQPLEATAKPTVTALDRAPVEHLMSWQTEMPHLKELKRRVSAPGPSSPCQLAQRELELRTTSLYRTTFLNHGDAPGGFPKPAASARTDLPAPAKRPSEAKAHKERQDTYWKNIAAATQLQEMNKSGYNEKERRIKLALTYPTFIPESLAKQNFDCDAHRGPPWRSDARENFGIQCHGADTNKRYQQPAKLVLLAKYKDCSAAC